MAGSSAPTTPAIHVLAALIKLAKTVLLRLFFS